MAAKWVETVILQQVNCVVRSRALEPLLFLRQDPEGGKNAEAGQQVELKVPQFDSVPSPKVSEFHALRTGNVLSSLLVGALSGAALGSVSNLCVRIVWL
jgi:hypothetical protein